MASTHMDPKRCLTLRWPSRSTIEKSNFVFLGPSNWQPLRVGRCQLLRTWMIYRFEGEKGSRFSSIHFQDRKWRRKVRNQRFGKDGTTSIKMRQPRSGDFTGLKKNFMHNRDNYMQGRVSLTIKSTCKNCTCISKQIFKLYIAFENYRFP